MKRNQSIGVLSLFSSAAIYGMYGVFSKLIGEEFGIFSQSWTRNLIVLTLSLILIYLTKSSIKVISKKDIKWILLWVLSGSWVSILTFIAFNNMKIGTAYFLIYSTMISFGFLSGKIFFKEKISKAKIVSLGLALGGLLVIYRFSISNDEILYATACLAAGGMVGVWNTISKKFSDNYSNLQIVSMDAVVSTIIGLVGFLITKEKFPVDANQMTWIWITLYGIAQLASVGFVVYGFKNLEAQIGSIILPVEIIFATVFSFLFFKEQPIMSAYIGGAMIFSSAIIPSIETIIKEKRK